VSRLAGTCLFRKESFLRSRSANMLLFFSHYYLMCGVCRKPSSRGVRIRTLASERAPSVAGQNDAMSSVTCRGNNTSVTYCIFFVLAGASACAASDLSELTEVSPPRIDRCELADGLAC